MRSEAEGQFIRFRPQWLKFWDVIGDLDSDRVLELHTGIRPGLIPVLQVHVITEAAIETARVDTELSYNTANTLLSSYGSRSLDTKYNDLLAVIIEQAIDSHE